jgi:hypothetical protein
VGIVTGLTFTFRHRLVDYPLAEGLGFLLVAAITQGRPSCFKQVLFRRSMRVVTPGTLPRLYGGVLVFLVELLLLIAMTLIACFLPGRREKSWILS